MKVGRFVTCICINLFHSILVLRNQLVSFYLCKSSEQLMQACLKATEEEEAIEEVTEEVTG